METLIPGMMQLASSSPRSDDLTSHLTSSFIEVEKILDVKEEEVTETVDDVIDNSVGQIEEIPDIKSIVANAKTSPKNNAMKSEGKADNEDESDAAIVHKSGSIDSLSRVQEDTDGDDPTAVKSLFKIFNHVERCRMVLNRIWDDPYAISFRDPVDTEEYDDYLEIVDEPICLSDVRTKLENGEYNKYFYHVKFANDMRKIWKNCKIYNLYQSQIWYSAHALSLLFERLFQGWVVMFSDGSIDFNDPLGRPWEPACRVCLQEENDPDLMLCDHCDAAYHIYCLRPKFKQVPDGPWVCARCTAWFAKSGKKMLSATAEDEARQYAEGAKSRKVVKVKKKKYLVKWRGLSYRECTWETVEDINDDDRIADYHKVNDNPPEEPPLTKAEIGLELSKERRVQILPPARLPNPLQDLDAIIYAQIRAYHFLKWKKLPPTALLRESGPSTLAYVHGMRRPMLLESVPTSSNDADNPKPATTDDWFSPVSYDPVRSEVADLLSDVVYYAGRMIHTVNRDPYPARPKLPSAHRSPSEFEVCLPKRLKGFGLQVGNYYGYMAVVGYRREGNIPFDKYMLELMNRVKMGDIIVAIDGIYLNGLNYTTVLNILRSKTKSPQHYVYLRLLRIPVTDEDCSNPDAIKNYFESKSDKVYLRPHLVRSIYLGVHPVASQTNNFQRWSAEYYESKTYKHVVIGEYDDEDEAGKAYDAAIRTNNLARAINYDLNGQLTASSASLRRVVMKERQENDERLARLLVQKDDDMTMKSPSKEAKKEENSKEEMIDDAMDNNSYDSRDSDSLISSDSSDSESDADSDHDEAKVWLSKESEDDEDWKPKKVENLLESDGPMGRLLRAVNESDQPPIRSEWTNYLLDQFLKDSASQVLVKKKKILQIDMASLSIIREWDNIPEIARNLGISIIDIQAVLVNKKDSAGGFIWKYSTAMPNQPTATDDEANGDELDSNGQVIAKKPSAASWKSKLYTQSKNYRSGGKLRDYQVDGLNWLLSCWYSKRSSILADEMGLGKTVQVVSFLEHLFEVEKLRGPFLVCVPLSTIQHWKRESETWTNMITCLYHDAGGGRDMRDIIREYEWYYKGHSRRLLKFHLLITTYDDLIRDYEELAEIPWRVVVVDEAHRLRNLNSKLLECMRSVVAKGMIAYGYQHRILMSGTPLQNNTTELWTLLNFIEPAKFPSIEKFNEKYGRITTQDQVESLQLRLGPHLLRRVKEDVAKDIPPKEETIIDVELTTIQKQYYRAIFEKNHSFLLQNLKGTVPKLMNIQMELRKCCNHPFLVDGVEQYEMEQLDSQLAQEGITNYLPSIGNRIKLRASDHTASQQSKGATNEFEKRRMEKFVIPTSGKMVLIDKLLPKLQNEGHKVLIFSQMVKMIDIIDEYCEYRGYPCERLDGRISGNERQKAIDRFNREANSFVFLLSTRAGGVGINLTAADTVIIVDSDWNPQVSCPYTFTLVITI
jgi:SNF2 family DNA or RNA helicase